MYMIAFLGMGMLGSNFVRVLLKKGHAVNVWNRTPAKAEALEVFGAKTIPTPAEAVTSVKRVHITLKDDETVEEVLHQAEPGLVPGCLIIDHTTTSAAGASRRTAYWKEKGFIYVHAPVFMGPQNALESTGMMLVSGDQQLIGEVTPRLAEMTGKVVNFGDDATKAAGLKLIGNLLLIAMTGGLSDALSLAGATGVTVEDMAKLFETFNPGNTLQARLKKMTSDTFDQPTWELNMARKDAGLMMNEVSGKPPMVVVPAVAAVMDKCIANGLGSKDWTIIAKDSL
jgi:3-hydroxyisobutyrate dehydrogenase